MFYWTEGDGGGPRPVHMSRSDILRGIVTEKLSTAAQEILAVVERTVAGYEEEAAALRREVERQRRQLLLLQPRVQLERKALVPDPDPDPDPDPEPDPDPDPEPEPDPDGQEVVVLSEEEEQGSGVEDTGSLGLTWYNDDDDDEEQQLSAEPESDSSQRREDLKDPDFQIRPRGRSDRRRTGRPRTSDAQKHVDLRVCVLEDSGIRVLTGEVFEKNPVQELRCPRGLQELDFLDLLRSTFPQLAAPQLFDMLATDRSKRLRRLRAAALTPEEVCRSLGSARDQILVIRLKGGDDPPSDGEDLHPEDGGGSLPGVAMTTGAGETPASAGSACRSAAAAAGRRRRRGRPRLGEEPTHHDLRVCVLEDSQSDLLSRNVLTTSSVQDLRCPRGLREEDFLDLLRSSFPQLAADDKRLDVFKSNRSRRLQKLRVSRLTPEEICRSMRSTGVSKTLVYIRRKTGEEEEQEEEEEEEPQTNDEAAADSVVRRDAAALSCSRHVGPEEAEDEERRADEEHDGRPGPGSARPRGARPGVERRPGPSGKTCCRVCGVWYKVLGSLVKHAWRHLEDAQSVCGVCGEASVSAEELQRHLRKHQTTHDCSFCAKSFLTAAGLRSHTTLHTGNRPFACDVCAKTFAHPSSLAVHRWVHVSDKPHKCDRCPKAFGLKAQLRAHRKLHAGRDKYHCNVCGKALYDLRSLTRHKATHSGERRYGCEVCGKRFKLPSTLKSHEKIHTARERPFLCHVCCKTFLSNCGLTAHMKTHSDERPYVCAVCAKGFISNGELKVHMRVHTNEAPYGCSQCGRFFKRKTHLNNHMRSHLGIKLFVCAVCGKACSRQEHLTVHMRTHNGERPYVCAACGKAFTQSHCLKTHMRSHREDQDPFLRESTS